MKLKSSILSLSAAALLFSACEPRDQKITRPDNRVGANGSPAAQTDGKAENYKYIATLAERQVEAIELFRALTDAQFVTEKNVHIEDTEVNGAKLKKVSFQADLSSGKWKIKKTTVLLADVSFDENGKLKKIVAQAVSSQPSKESVIDTERQLDISLSNSMKNISIENAGNDSWNVNLVSRDDINLKIGKSTMLNILKFSFSATAPDSNIFAIKNIEMTHMRSGTLVGDFALKSDDAKTTMTVETKTGEKCSTVSGVLQLSSLETKKNKDGSQASLYERTLTYDSSGVTVKAGKDDLSLSTAECENRLSVDLRKLL